MKKAALLCRVSTEIQEYSRQIQELREIARMDGYEIPDDLIYAEKVSGLAEIKDRVQLTRLLDDIKSKEKNIHMIYANHVDRIARHPKKIMDIIYGAEKHSVCFNVIGAGKTLLEDGTVDNNVMLVLSVQANVAKMDYDKIKKNFKSGKRQAARLGRFTGGNFKPFGYTTDANKKFIIEPNEARIVKEMYQMAIDGYGCKQIGNYLKKQGIKTKGGKSDWSDVVIHQILTNELNKGLRAYIKKKGERESEHEYEHFNLPELAIVDEQTWDNAIEAMKGRNVRHARNVKHLYLLDSKVYCGCCKNTRFLAKYSPGSSAYYGCYNRKFSVKGKECKNAGIGIGLLEGLVWTAVKSSPYIINHLKESQADLKQIRTDIRRLEGDIEHWHDEQESKTKERKKLVNMMLKELIEEDEGEKMMKAVNQTLKKLEYKIESAKKDIKSKQALEKKIDNIDNLVQSIADISTDRTQLNGLMKVVIDKVVVNSATPPVKQLVCNQFIISIWIVGKKEPIVVLFDRKAKTIQHNETIDKVIRYDENNNLVDDMNELLEAFESAKPKGKMKSKHIQPVDVIPFISDEQKEAV